MCFRKCIQKYIWRYTAIRPAIRPVNKMVIKPVIKPHFFRQWLHTLSSLVPPYLKVGSYYSQLKFWRFYHLEKRHRGGGVSQKGQIRVLQPCFVWHISRLSRISSLPSFVSFQLCYHGLFTMVCLLGCSNVGTILKWTRNLFPNFSPNWFRILFPNLVRNLVRNLVGIVAGKSTQFYSLPRQRDGILKKRYYSTFFRQKNEKN